MHQHYNLSFKGCSVALKFPAYCCMDLYQGWGAGAIEPANFGGAGAGAGASKTSGGFSS